MRRGRSAAGGTRTGSGAGVGGAVPSLRSRPARARGQPGPRPPPPPGRGSGGETLPPAKAFGVGASRRGRGGPGLQGSLGQGIQFLLWFGGFGVGFFFLEVVKAD